jgi:hypothetical protein
VPTKIQITVDCIDPDQLVRFWAVALNYIVEPAPDGFATWRAYWISLGEPEEELGDGDCADSIVDPAGLGPRLWFQPVPEAKAVKNRLHLDLGVSGGRAVAWDLRKERVDDEASRLTAVGASTLVVHSGDGAHYSITMADPEGNEFCIH